MAPLARWCFRHRRIVLPAWLLALVLVATISHAVGSSYANNFSFPATDSSQAQDIVKANFPTQAGDSDQIVVQAKTGTLSDPQIRSAVVAMLGNVQRLGFVTDRRLALQHGVDLQRRHHRLGHRPAQRRRPDHP